MSNFATIEEFRAHVLTVLPNAYFGFDNDGQIVVYTNHFVLTDADNPSIPAGEYVIVSSDNNQAV